MMRTMSPLIDGLYRQGEKIADTKAPEELEVIEVSISAA